jgi:copper transport protein
MKWARLAILLFVLVCLAVTLVTPVQAHALPVRTIPPANAVLSRSPAQIEIYFTQAVDPTFSKITVLDENGNRVDAGDVTLDPADNTHLVVSMQPVKGGVYTVVWTALSATDGHQATGSFPFAVGNENASALASAPQSSGSARLTAPQVISKGFLYLAVAALAGSILFSNLVWKPSLRQAAITNQQVGAYPPYTRRLAMAAVILLLVTDLLSVPLQAGLASGQAILPPWDPRLAAILFTTRFGALALARLGLAFCAAWLILPAENRWNRWAALLACLALALTLSLESHAADEAAPFLPVLVDWVHLAAVSIWVGGLYHFLAGLWSTRALPVEERTRFNAHLIPHFSSLALVSVGSLALTGLYSAILRVGTFQTLFSTTYGQALIVKIALALPMIALGAVNLLHTSPRMRRAANEPGGSPRLLARFQKLVTGEVIIGTLILIWVGLFTSLPPAQLSAAPTGFQQTTNIDDLSVSLNIAPARVGVNTFTVMLLSNGQHVNDAKEVDLEFNSVSGRVPSSKAQMVALGPGMYNLKGSYLGTPDQWQIQVVTIRPNKFDAYATFHLNLNSNASTSTPWNQIDAGLAVFAGIAYFLAYRSLVSIRKTGNFTFLSTKNLRFFVDKKVVSYFLGWVLWIVPALALILGGILIYFNSPDALKINLVNPIPPNAASLAEGKTLYQQNCLACHGTAGKGDGPVGLTLNPRPADLSYHTQPGVHSDGQLFDWITNGFPGSAMPAFSQKLSDTQRWNLVNYIRTLAPKPLQAAP